MVGGGGGGGSATGSICGCGGGGAGSAGCSFRPVDVNSLYIVFFHFSCKEHYTIEQLVSF